MINEYDIFSLASTRVFSTLALYGNLSCFLMIYAILHIILLYDIIRLYL